MLIVNKCEEGLIRTEIINDIYQLNFGEPIFISAE